jgi:hypothetical protein
MRGTLNVANRMPPSRAPHHVVFVKQLIGRNRVIVLVKHTEPVLRTCGSPAPFLSSSGKCLDLRQARTADAQVSGACEH